MTDSTPEPDPRIDEGPATPDFGIPHIDLDKYGRFKVPKHKADYCLLEQAHNEFYLGMGLDKPQFLAWLWPERIAIGKLTLIEGESNSGTSFVVTDLAARVTSGSPWPGTTLSQTPLSQTTGSPTTDAQPAGAPPILSEPGAHVLFVNGGDNIGDTLTPRLISMGANMADVTILAGIDTHDPAEMRAGKTDTRRRLCLPADLGHIEYQLRQRPDTRLVVVDSLSDFCQTDKQFRETLRGLHEMAERCHVAVVATARPKNGRSARSKLQPSADRRAESVRCVLNVLVDPQDPSQRYLAPARMNFCREPQWLPFRIGEGIIDWGQPLETAPVYRRQTAAAQEKVTLLQEAMDCLRDTLATGDLPALSALKQVMECGFSKGTVVRARRELGVRSYREGFGVGGMWYWSLNKEECSTNENGAPSFSREAQPSATQIDSPRKKQPSPADEFGGVSFERMFHALFVEALNHNEAKEEVQAAMAESNGKPANGKPGKNGKRKQRDEG
jgi:hypothetical protein